MKEIAFTKMVGTGNDFIVVDNRAGGVPARAMAKKWCDRKYSIGADGLLLLERSRKADFRMRIINSDGSEAEMCGNGIRCIAQYAYDRGITGKKFKIETLAGIIDVTISGRVVKARMIDPKDLKLNFSIPVSGKPLELSFVNTGVPHAVSVVKRIKEVDVQSTGRQVRTHDYFKPRGTNANFIQVLGGNKIEVRTYERGVEGETLSCGTGSTASALIASAVCGWKSPVSVKTQSGETLKVYFSKEGNRFHDVYLEGSVQKSFEGRVKL